MQQWRVRTAPHRLGPALASETGDGFLAQTEVSELDVTVCIQEDVLRLQVAIHDVKLVQMLQRQYELSRVQAHPRL